VGLLNDLPEFEVIGEAGDGAAALELAERLSPDVILLDVNMPTLDGVETVRALRGSGNTVHILMLTISKNEADLLGAIQAGADGYLLKSAEPEELRRAILQIAAGNAVLSPHVTRQILTALNQGPQAVPAPLQLSERELDVLRLLAKGRTSAQISATLFISENTVKTHVRHILEKLAAANRAEAVAKANRLGLLSGGS
jgi:DNA-binding NarL/FixJ family response regulator